MNANTQTTPTVTPAVQAPAQSEPFHIVRNMREAVIAGVCLFPDFALTDLATQHKLPLFRLIELLEEPESKPLVTQLRSILALRAELLAAQAKHASTVAILHKIQRDPTSTESLRLASTILRTSKPAAKALGGSGVPHERTVGSVPSDELRERADANLDTADDALAQAAEHHQQPGPNSRSAVATTPSTQAPAETAPATAPAPTPNHTPAPMSSSPHPTRAPAPSTSRPVPHAAAPHAAAPHAAAPSSVQSAASVPSPSTPQTHYSPDRAPIPSASTPNTKEVPPSRLEKAA